MGDGKQKNAQNFCKVLKRQNLQNQATCGLYTDDNKSKYFSNPKNIFKSAKKFDEQLYTKETISKAATTEFLAKTPNRKKICNAQFNHVGVKITLDETTKSINSKSNNKFLGNNLTAKFYKYFLMA